MAFDFFEKHKTGTAMELPVSELEPSRTQPRVHFDEASVQELADSIRVHGMMRPVVVQKSGEHYEIIDGERRWRAAQRAGYDTIPCSVLSPEENRAAEKALIEAIRNEDLTAVEEARSYVQLMRQSSFTQEEAARKVGKSQSAIANKIRLLNLPREIQEAVNERRISERHARALLALPAEKQKTACRYIEEKNLNVRDTEAYVEDLTGKSKRRHRQKTKGFARNIQIGVNSINQCIAMIKKMGIDVAAEKEETPADVRIIVRFPRQEQ